MNKKPYLSPQAQTVLEALEAGHLVTRLTMMNLGVMNLTARMAELRNAGYSIVCKMDKDLRGNRYGKFSLNRDAAKAAA